MEFKSEQKESDRNVCRNYQLESIITTKHTFEMDKQLPLIDCMGTFITSNNCE